MQKNIGTLGLSEITMIEHVLKKLGIIITDNRNWEYFYGSDYGEEFDVDLTFDITSETIDGSISSYIVNAIKEKLTELHFILHARVNTYSYNIKILLEPDYVKYSQHEGETIKENNTTRIMNFKEYHAQLMNEDGDGGDAGGDFGGATPSNTPGIGNPSPGGASGDSTSSDFGSGDTWSFASIFPNNMIKSRKKRKITKKRKK